VGYKLIASKYWLAKSWTYLCLSDISVSVHCQSAKLCRCERSF